jgi:hypothetical protein
MHEVEVGWVREFGPSIGGRTHQPRGPLRSQGEGGGSQGGGDDINMMDMSAPDA